ncbi:MAG: acylphosphatase [Candidatus Thermoplasmatota archaeon]|nr:acylphosphatase [Candidatus Thermoplasmatota archaeon]
MQEVRAHIFFTGKVQGVYFRANTNQKAKEMGIRGWVKNMPDGRVEAVFEGSREGVDATIEYCKNGQPYARVLETEIRWEEPKGDPSFLVIR